MWDSSMTALIVQGTFETLYMTLASTLLAYLIGLPMGVLLVTSDSEGIVPMRLLNQVLNIVVNITRSIPFLILLITSINEVSHSDSLSWAPELSSLLSSVPDEVLSLSVCVPLFSNLFLKNVNCMARI